MESGAPIPPPSPARTRDPATVVDLAEARRRALPGEALDQAVAAIDRAEGIAGDMLATIDRIDARRRHLGRAILLLFAAVVGVVVYALLPGGAP